jgi:hypothetical protein
MKRFLRARFGLGTLVLALAFCQACARSQTLRSNDASSPSNEEKLPFHPEDDKSATSDNARPAVSPDPKPSGDLPFRASSQLHNLPAGTLLTVQLESPLTSRQAHAGDEFTASVVAPLIIDGNTLIDRGTAVTGSIESMQSRPGRPGGRPATGYFRLALTAIEVEGREVPIQTSSLFARAAWRPQTTAGASSSRGADGVRIQEGRRLTFRLTTPVNLIDAKSPANSPIPKPAGE